MEDLTLIERRAAWWQSLTEEQQAAVTNDRLERAELVQSIIGEADPRETFLAQIVRGYRELRGIPRAEEIDEPYPTIDEQAADTVMGLTPSEQRVLLDVANLGGAAPREDDERGREDRQSDIELIQQLGLRELVESPAPAEGAVLTELGCQVAELLAADRS